MTSTTTPGQPEPVYSLTRTQLIDALIDALDKADPDEVTTEGFADEILNQLTPDVAVPGLPAAEPTTACRTDRHRLCGGYRCTCDCHRHAAVPDLASGTTDAPAGYVPPNYDADFDNCAGGCRRNDNRRVAFAWYQDLHFACPGCFEELFGGPPGEGQPIITLTCPGDAHDMDLTGTPCPAHGTHPHGGRRCVDCAACVRSVGTTDGGA